MLRAQHVDLTSLIVPAPDGDVVAARRAASDAAKAAERADLLEGVRSAAAGWVLQAFANRGYSGTWAATEYAVSVARPKDRTAVAEALADAVTADVVEDLVDPDIADTLRSTWSVLAESAAIPEPGALNNLTRSIASAPRERPAAQALAVAALVLLAGLLGLAMGQAFGFGLVIAAAVLLANALRGRAS